MKENFDVFREIAMSFKACAILFAVTIFLILFASGDQPPPALRWMFLLSILWPVVIAVYRGCTFMMEKSAKREWGVIIVCGALISVSFTTDESPVQPIAQNANAASHSTSDDKDMVRLRKGRYAKVGNAQIIFCRNSGGKGRDLKHAKLPVGTSGKRDMLWLKDQCFPKTLEFQYEIVKRPMFGDAILIRTGIPLGGARLLWVYERDIRGHSVQSYRWTSRRELFDTLHWR